MSNNKLKYWEVSNTIIVKANTKAEAVKASRSRRPVEGTQVLSTFTSADRVTAAEARLMSESV